MRTVRSVNAVVAELDDRYKDWFTFPVYRRVPNHCHLDDILFHDAKNEPATGSYSNESQSYVFSFFNGSWQSAHHKNLYSVKRRR